MNKKRFDVLIVNTKTGLIESVIGTNLTAERAEQRVMMGVSRTNIGPYCVLDVPANVKHKVGAKPIR